MLLREKDTGHFVEILDIESLANPFCQSLSGRLHWGEEAADPELYMKSALCFVSGEPLPQCWLNDHYRDNDVMKRLNSSVKKTGLQGEALPPSSLS